MAFIGIVMAAGEGTRMRSRIPKPLHRICGKEMVRYPVELLKDAGAERVVAVVSPENQGAIRAVLGGEVDYAVQPQRDGTAGALACCAPLLQGQAERLLVVGGDTPLVSRDSVNRLLQEDEGRGVVRFLTGKNPELYGLGSVIYEEGYPFQIVEAGYPYERSGRYMGVRTAEAREVDPDAELNAGFYCFKDYWVWDALKLVMEGSGERPITGLLEIALEDVKVVKSVPVASPDELIGVNDRAQLAQAEAVMRRRIREHWMLQGVTMTDPDSVYIDADVTIGMDTVILPNTMLTGRASIGENCEIGPNSVIRDSVIGNDCRVTSSALEEATMEDNTDIGPFSHLRPGAYLESGVHIGNYVEVKESRFKAGAAMGHFGYAGDATIGERVNIGAGMITCNYDGKDKHRTVVEDDAFIGCDTMLVAPVTVGEGSITGAGAVVTKDIPPARLAVGVPATIRRNLK